MDDMLREECGVFGIYSSVERDVATDVYYGLYALQHRGQESCGIAVNSDGIIHCLKEAGLVNDVFAPDVIRGFEAGRIAIGHVRYGFSSLYPKLEAQPITVNHIKGSTALANNGSLTNAAELREELELTGSIFHSFSDAEVIAQIITKERLTSTSIEQAIGRAMDKLKGSYSLVVMSATKLIAARDPLGFHPLCIGQLGDSYIFASETVALDSVGATFLRDIKPGEIVTVTGEGQLVSDMSRTASQKTALCSFELIYFARPDSVVDGCSVHLARQRAGALLAKQHPVDADIVIGVPDSGLDAALGYALESGIPYGIGLIKNKYIGRTFIQPAEDERKTLVRIKLNAIAAVIKDKRVIMVDDSIVRGTTSARIVKVLREAGAREVHFRSSAPPFLFPCYYGTDIDSPEKLIANRFSHDEIAKRLGVDTLGYLDPASVGQIASEISLGLCDACFTGKYPTSIKENAKKPIYMIKLSEKNR